ncbi:MAG: phosphoribosyl-ATP diphosphatase [Oscillospiraceae bacterium]|nr:phosphoribosyl-ATP diphosphatase [Oscillospiraceae bacterium]MDD4367670.1 phosphoribosyl-ATP diphosphatase [Oscillospiraceae bacterium]
MSDIGKMMDELYAVVKDRQANPREGSYTNYLFDKGIDKICKKVGEESAEVIIASKNNAPDEIIYEVSDLLYHLNVLLVDRDVTWQAIADELASRRER